MHLKGDVGLGLGWLYLARCKQNSGEAWVTESLKQVYRGQGQGEKPWDRQPWRREGERQKDRIKRRQTGRQVCVPELERGGQRSRDGGREEIK